MRHLALLALLLTPPAMAQELPIETVTVNAKSLTGIWHGGLVQLGYWGGHFFGPELQSVTEGFCRIAPRDGSLTLSCLQTGDQPATIVDDGNGVRLRWGSAMLYRGGGFEGEWMNDSHFRGRFHLTSWGNVHENPLMSDVTRVTPDANAPDAAGKAALLRRILERGLDGVPQDAKALQQNGLVVTALTLPKLGGIQAIAYLGQEDKVDLPPDISLQQIRRLDPANLPKKQNFFSVYWVRFATGERLCGLHQREDGVLDAFRCA